MTTTSASGGPSVLDPQDSSSANNNNNNTNDPPVGAKRGLFGGMRFFGGTMTGPPPKSRAELLEEEKRRQEAIIQEQLQALHMGTQLEEQKRRQEELVQVTVAEQQKRRHDEEQRKQQEEEKERREQEERKKQQKVEAQERQEPEPTSTAPALSALERRRRQRQQASISRPSPRTRRQRNSHSREQIVQALDHQIDRLSPKGKVTKDDYVTPVVDCIDSSKPGPSLSPAVKTTVSQETSPQGSTTSLRRRLSSSRKYSSGSGALSDERANIVPSTSPGISPKPSGDRPTPLQLNQYANQSRSSPSSRQRRASRITSRKVDALSAHLESERKKTSRNRKNRHGDDVSLGTMLLQHQLQSPTTTPKNSKKVPLEQFVEVLSTDTISSPPMKEERPWESVSVQELVDQKKSKYRSQQAEAKSGSGGINSKQDDPFLDEANSVFEKSVFGLTDEGNESLNYLDKGSESAGRIEVAPTSTVEENGDIDNEEETVLPDGGDFETTWTQTDTDQNFVAELKRLKAKQGRNQQQQQQPSSASALPQKEELMTRLKLFEGGKGRGKKSKKGKTKPVFSKEFKQAMDSVFAVDGDEDEYTATFSTRMVEGLPRDLKDKLEVDEGTAGNESGESGDDKDIGDHTTPEVAGILQRLRERSMPDHSDLQSVRSRRTTRSQATDSRSRRTARTHRSERSHASRTSRTPSRTPSQTNPVARRDRSSDRSTALGRSSRSGTRSKSRTKSPSSEAASRTHSVARRDRSSDRSTKSRTKSPSSEARSKSRTKSPSSEAGESTSPMRRALKGTTTARRRTNSADASRISQSSRTSPMLSSRRSASTGRPRAETSVGPRSRSSSRRGRRNDNVCEDDSRTISGSRSAVSRAVPRSTGSARTWSVARASIDPAEFYQREMERLKNRTISTGGLQKEMSELRQQQRKNTSTARLKLPKSSTQPHHDEPISLTPSKTDFGTDFFETARPGNEAQTSLFGLDAHNLDYATNGPGTFLSPLQSTDTSSSTIPRNVLSDGFNEDEENGSSGKTSPRRFPRMPRALFKRQSAATKVEENEERLL